MTLSIAFKEWAVICRALAEGRQSLILRKGGIAEAGGQFRPEHDRFLLYPTYFHEQHHTGTKADLYAVAKIPEYWVLDVINRKLIAFRNPVDGEFTDRSEYEPNESISPLAAAASTIEVSRMLPRE